MVKSPKAMQLVVDRAEARTHFSYFQSDALSFTCSLLRNLGIPPPTRKQPGWNQSSSSITVTSSRPDFCLHPSVRPQWSALSSTPHQPPCLQLSTLVLLKDQYVSPYNLATQNQTPFYLGFPISPIISSSPFMTQPTKPTHSPSEALYFCFFLHLPLGHASVSVGIHVFFSSVHLASSPSNPSSNSSCLGITG